MKLARFRTFTDELAVDSDMRSAQSTVVYRLFDGAWFDQQNKRLDDQVFLARLEQARTAPNGILKASKSKTCLFGITDLDAVVAANFTVSPGKAKRDRIRRALSRCLQHSGDAFAARHDGLTGAFNKIALEKHLVDLVGSARTSQSPSSATMGGTATFGIIAAIALDIDHFKQLNDTHGHLYGDVVLKCFATRIERALAQNLQTRTGISLVLGRTGGEEFVVICSGQITDDELLELAETIRTSVADEPLPSEDEWARFQKDVTQDALSLPHVSERRVTTSIGIASSLPLSTKVDAKTLSIKLLSDADTALYRAKSGGRNIVRRFSDILMRHGRVLEHHPETGIVAIDIGSRVHVAQGQEFLVYHPQFAGTAPFVHSDGRTKKRIGTYPRFSNGRIVAFDVQPELSFCKVHQSTAASTFAVGSVLEAVPIGAIAHILAGETKFGGLGNPEVSSADEIVASIRNTVANGQQPVVCVFTIANIEQLVKDRGTAFINHSLAQLYGIARDTFIGCRIGQVHTLEIAVAANATTVVDAAAAARTVVDEARSKCGGLPEFVAGVFQEGQKRSDGAPDARRALDLARYAVSEAGRDDKSPVTVFSVRVAINVLERQRGNRQYASVMADYRKFYELGVQDAALENQAAASALEMSPSDFEFAEAAFQRATQMAADPIYKANLGVLFFYRGARSSAYKHFVEAVTQDAKAFPETYLAAYAMSAYALLQDQPGSLTADFVRSLIKHAMQVPADKRFWTKAGELETALDLL